MKDSKDKAHRISNLKNMINNMNDEKDVNEIYDDIEEDSELIDYLNEDKIDYDTLGIDDEYIYRPGNDDGDAFNLEENNINEDYIIKTPKAVENDENNDFDDLEELSIDFGGEISENFDNVINAKIGGKPILAIVSSVLGIILIIISLYIFQSRSDRVIDNVVSGESNFLFIIFSVIGILLIIYGVLKLFNFTHPFENITASINNLEKEENTEKKDDTEDKKPKPLQKSNIPLDKESYKIGEFDMNDLKKTLKQPTESKTDSEDEKEETSERKDVITKEIEEIEYEKAKLEGESIDEIFAEIDDDALYEDSEK